MNIKARLSDNIFITSLFLIIVTVGVCMVKPVNAKEYISKAQVKTLYQAPIPGLQGKEMIVKHLALPAKFEGGKHMHPGPVYVYVLEGELTVQLEGGAKTFKAGNLYAEDINTAMIAKNISTYNSVKILVFQIGSIGQPMMIKVK
ncbi:MAG: cupin domain-containing protein [Moritella sp.]|uniref:cupin domain-containing protein n=1 Tax=Moritella sp. TaxID=78556 RepID=UPI0025F3161F|nr:cupin domain-containing protein [Moritella sp.]NQZ92077.1 cupin domain-containing protein [Moritella sp.]